MRKLRSKEEPLKPHENDPKAQARQPFEIRTGRDPVPNPQPYDSSRLSPHLQDLFSMIRLNGGHDTELLDFEALLVDMQDRCESLLIEPDFFEDDTGELLMTWTDSKRTTEVSWRIDGWLIQGTEIFGPLTNVRHLRVSRRDLSSIVGAMWWAIKEIPWPRIP